MSLSGVSSRTVVNGLLVTALIVCAIPSLLAIGARWVWLFDLLTHFRAHYLAAFIFGGVLCLALKRFKLAVTCAVFAVYNLWFVAPLYIGGERAGVEVQDTLVRVMTVNAYCANPQRDRLIEYIVEQSPDLLLVMEVDSGWAERLQSLANRHPYRLIEARIDDCFGIALLSKLPATKMETRIFGSAGVRSVVAKFERNGQLWFHFVGTHPLPPIRRSAAELRNEQLRELGQFVNSLDGPVVFAGDLNTTSWSPYFSDLLNSTGLRDSRRGFGNQPTWRSDVLWFGLAIDHVLISPEIAVCDRWVGPDVGSDHRPVVVDLSIPPKM